MDNRVLYREILASAEPNGRTRYVAKRLFEAAIAASDYSPRSIEENITRLVAVLLIKHPDTVNAGLA